MDHSLIDTFVQGDNVTVEVANYKFFSATGNKEVTIYTVTSYEGRQLLHTTDYNVLVNFIANYTMLTEKLP